MDDDFFPKLRRFCDERGILIVADEVLTGMGRTGKFFCMEHYGTRPDIVTVGKGFGNGFPVTAMLVSERYKGSINKISASTSYGGNPMACGAALASIEAIEEESLLEHSLALGAYFEKRMAAMKEAHPIIGDVRGKGCLLGIELVKDRKTKEPGTDLTNQMLERLRAHGLLVGKGGLYANVIRMSPPLNISKADVDVAIAALDKSLAEVAAK